MVLLDHVQAIEFERTRRAARSRLERIALCARDCCSAPANLLDRIGRALRRSAHPC